MFGLYPDKTGGFVPANGRQGRGWILILKGNRRRFFVTSGGSPNVHFNLLHRGIVSCSHPSTTSGLSPRASRRSKLSKGLDRETLEMHGKAQGKTRLHVYHFDRKLRGYDIEVRKRRDIEVIAYRCKRQDGKTSTIRSPQDIKQAFDYLNNYFTYRVGVKFKLKATKDFSIPNTLWRGSVIRLTEPVKQLLTDYSKKNVTKISAFFTPVVEGTDDSRQKRDTDGLAAGIGKGNWTLIEDYVVPWSLYNKLNARGKAVANTRETALVLAHEFSHLLGATHLNLIYESHQQLKKEGHLMEGMTKGGAGISKLIGREFSTIIYNGSKRFEKKR